MPEPPPSLPVQPRPAAFRPRGRGARPSPPDGRDFRFDPGHYRAAGAPPASVDLRGYDRPTPAAPLGAVRDQGQGGACVAFAATALRAALRVAAGAPPVVYSPLFTWWEARRREGSENENTGVYPRDALDSLLRDGALAEPLDPYDWTRYSAAPTPQQLAAARPFRLGSYHALAGADQIRQALAARAPVIGTIRAWDAFDRTGPDGVVSAEALAETGDWNHEVILGGYTPGWWILQNSWGEGWGNGGYFYLPEDALERFILEPWTASLRAVA